MKRMVQTWVLTNVDESGIQSCLSASLPTTCFPFPSLPILISTAYVLILSFLSFCLFSCLSPLGRQSRGDAQLDQGFVGGHCGPAGPWEVSCHGKYLPLRYNTNPPWEEHKSLQSDSSLTSKVMSALTFTCMSRMGDLLSDVVCSSQDDMVDLCVVSLVPLVFSYSYTSSRSFSGILFLLFFFDFVLNKCIIGELALPFVPHEFGSSYNSILTILCCSCIVQNDIDL